MSITADLLRGHTETIILAHLVRKDSYGYEINKHIQEKSGGLFEFKEATLYGAFRRLEETGAITSYWGGEATGARRRYYTITDNGRSLYEANLAEWKQAKTLIDTFISVEGNSNE